MTAADPLDYTLPGNTLLDALERIVGPLPPRQMLPDERRTHEAAFEVDGPDPLDLACPHPAGRCRCDQAADYHYRNEVC